MQGCLRASCVDGRRYGQTHDFEVLPQSQPYVGVNRAADALDAAAARETADVAFGHAIDRVAENLAVRRVSIAIASTDRVKVEVNTYRCLFAVLLFPFPKPTPTPLALAVPKPMSERSSG